MDASLETLVIAAYVFACSLSIPRPGPAGKVTDQELIALAVAQAITGLVSDRQFLGDDRTAAARLLPVPARAVAVQPPAAAPDAADHDRAATASPSYIAAGSVRLVDGTLLALRQLRGLCVKERVRRACRLRLLPVQEPLVWGMRLLLITRSPGCSARL